MHIVYLHQYFNSPRMAGSTRSYEVARRLVRAGHVVHMVTTWRQPTDQRDWFTTDEDGIRVHWLPLPYANAMSYLRRVSTFLRFAWRSTVKACALEADVIFATSTPLTIAIPAMIAARKQGVPFVFEVRDMWPDVPIALGIIRNPILITASRWLERMAYRKASHIIALAPGMRTDIIAKDIPAEKVSVVPNGCDNELYASPPRPRDVRAEHDWLGDRKLVIYAGAIGSANGVEYLVHVASHVAVLDNNVRFAVFGDGRDRRLVEQLARDKGILDKTFFLFDAIPKEELVPWLKAADLHVALMKGPEIYLKDAVNNKFFDALATGKPIASNFDGWQTRIADEADVGVRLDDKDHRAAASELVRALRDEAWLAGVAVRAGHLARTQFDRDALARDVETALVAAVARARRGCDAELSMTDRK